ncbi:MAG TPA: hypothetical protein VFA43_25235 [Gemmatimonadaceae bacterium]|nr:hypothetical protein [Gemmatimonadaceae bacterium]
MRLGSAEEHVSVGIWPRKSMEATGGDVLVSVAVRCDGYVGDTTQWVLPQAWDKFVAELRELEHTRQGQAVLETDFGDAFLLRLFSTDRAGHMAVSGMVRFIRRQQDAGALELSFGPIAFDPTTLPELVRTVEKA